jgi:hypothetical protein
MTATFFDVVAPVGQGRHGHWERTSDLDRIGNRAPRGEVETWRQRVEQAEADVYARARELQAAWAAESEARLPTAYPAASGCGVPRDGRSTARLAARAPAALPVTGTGSVDRVPPAP